MGPLRSAYPGGTVAIFVHFAGKLGPQGTPEGNVSRVELWVNGVLVDTIQNPPNVKSGTVTFHLDLSRYGEGTISLSAVAYQGNGKSAPSGASASKAVGVDLTDPTGTITIPTEGALVPSARPMARADYTDPPGAGGYASGIDRASVRLYDEHGADVTGDAEVGDSFLLYTPAPERALADGPHELRLHVPDLAGRTFETTRHFTTDTTPPGLTLETPADHASLFASDLAFSFSATDANGVALVSATVDGTDITERFARDGDRFTYTHHAGDTVVAELGLHTWHVVVADGAGNPTERSLTYTIVENPGGGGGTPTPPLYHIHILAGDGQTGAIGRCVDGPQIPGTPETAPGVPEKVLVVDDNANGAIAIGVPLVFRGRGKPVEAPGFSTVTNSDGIAAVRYILGRTEGDDPITVEVLGDPTAIGVTLHETAVKPTLFTTLGMSTEPGFAGKTLLAKGGDGWVFATLTRPGDPGERPIGISANMRLDVSRVVAGVATPAAESEMYVNPRSRMTTKYGAASFILIPDVMDDADWQAKLSIPDFPEIAPPPVSFRSSGTFSAGDVDHISELFATQGGITAVGHPVTLNADLTPMFTHIPPLAIALGLGFVVTHCELTVFGAAQDELGQTLYRFGNVDGGTGVASDGKWTDGHPDPHFALTVEPNAGSVGTYPWIMTASMKVVLVHPLGGGVVTGLYHERLVVGAPELRFVRSADRTELPSIRTRSAFDLPTEPDPSPAAFRVAFLTPMTVDRLPGTLRALDLCRVETNTVAGLPPVVENIEATLQPVMAGTRFRVFLSDPFLSLASGLPLPQGISRSEILVSNLGNTNFQEEGDFLSRDGLARSTTLIEPSDLGSGSPGPRDPDYATIPPIVFSANTYPHEFTGFIPDLPEMRVPQINWFEHGLEDRIPVTPHVLFQVPGTSTKKAAFNSATINAQTTDVINIYPVRPGVSYIHANYLPPLPEGQVQREHSEDVLTLSIPQLVLLDFSDPQLEGLKGKDGQDLWDMALIMRTVKERLITKLGLDGSVNIGFETITAGQAAAERRAADGEPVQGYPVHPYRGKIFTRVRFVSHDSARVITLFAPKAVDLGLTIIRARPFEWDHFVLSDFNAVSDGRDPGLALDDPFGDDELDRWEFAVEREQAHGQAGKAQFEIMLIRCHSIAASIGRQPDEKQKFAEALSFVAAHELGHALALVPGAQDHHFSFDGVRLDDTDENGHNIAAADTSNPGKLMVPVIDIAGMPAEIMRRTEFLHEEKLLLETILPTFRVLPH